MGVPASGQCPQEKETHPWPWWMGRCSPQGWQRGQGGSGAGSVQEQDRSRAGVGQEWTELLHSPRDVAGSGSSACGSCIFCLGEAGPCEPAASA